MDLSPEHIEKITGQQLRALHSNPTGDQEFDIYDIDDITLHDDLEECGNFGLQDIWFMVGYLDSE